MKKENCTKGPVQRGTGHGTGEGLAICKGAQIIATVTGKGYRNGYHPTSDANAELIADAFNVLHETGCTPRELADMVAEKQRFLAKLQQQCDELAAALSTSNEWLEGALLDEPEDFDNTELNDAVAANLKALSKYQPKTHA